MANQKLTALKAARTPIKAKLTRFKTFLQKIKNKCQSIKKLEGILEKFYPLYLESDSVQTKIESLLEKDEQALKEQEKQRDDFENDYFTAISDARTLLRENRQNPTSDVGRALTSSPGCSSQQSQYSAAPPFDLSQVWSANANTLNLPRVTILQFDGSFIDWVKFRDTFESMVHDRARISNIEKFHYLSAALTRDAARIIQSLGISDVSYELACKGLTDRYEDSGSIFHFHTKSIFELPPLTGSSDRKSVV